MNAKKAKAWFGYLLVAWPGIKLIAQGFGVPLPDLNGLGDLLGGVSAAAGGTMLASSQPIVGKEAKSQVL